MKIIKNLGIIDDDTVFTYLTKKTIEQTKLVEQIKIFGNGMIALKFLKENSDKPELIPEIILLDISMPIMDGWQFLEEYLLIKPRIGKKITIYIVSSSIAPHDMVRAKQISEVTDYIIKPISKDRFIEMVKQL